MQPAVRAVLVIAEIKAAIDEFENGDVNAQETLARITEACAAAVEPVPKRDAA